MIDDTTKTLGALSVGEGKRRGHVDEVKSLHANGKTRAPGPYFMEVWINPSGNSQSNRREFLNGSEGPN